MKIGIDCRLWNESGVGRYIRSLVRELQILDQKNKYTLFVLGKDKQEILHGVYPENSRRVQNDNFRIIKADIRWHSIEEQLKFPSILNKENLDLMHFTYSSVPIFYNKPFVVTIHDLIPYHFSTGLATTLRLPLYKLKLLSYKFVISQAAKKAKKIIAVSSATKDEVVDHLKVSEGKVVVTYEDSSLSSKLKAQSSKLQLKTQNYFLYVGNAYPHKNLDRLLKAFTLFCHPEASAEGSSQIILRQLADQNNINLILVGKEDYFYRRLKEKVKDMGLERSVLFYGEATDGELSTLYKNALALIMPSLMEGFGLPALEAMANKCLVLASDIPSLREICGDCAVYFDRFNVEDIAQTMKTIHPNDINPPVGEAGHYSGNIRKGFDQVRLGFERAKMFSWEKMSKETLRIYESCCR